MGHRGVTLVMDLHPTLAALASLLEESPDQIATVVAPSWPLEIGTLETM